MCRRLPGECNPSDAPKLNATAQSLCKSRRDFIRIKIILYGRSNLANINWHAARPRSVATGSIQISRAGTIIRSFCAPSTRSGRSTASRNFHKALIDSGVSIACLRRLFWQDVVLLPLLAEPFASNAPVNQYRSQREATAPGAVI